MDDANEQGPSGMERRDFLKRSAVVGGLVWAAPAISTVGSRAFAANGDGSPGGQDLCDGDLLQFKWESDEGFVSCGRATPGSEAANCQAATPYGSELIPCATATESIDVGKWTVDSHETFVRAERNGNAVTFSFPGADCTIQVVSAKGGKGPDGIRDCDSTITPGTEDSFTLFDDASIDSGVSNVTAVLCCKRDPVAAT